MPVYNKNGIELDSVYNASGVSLTSVFDKSGNEIPIQTTPDIPVTPLTWDMTDAYKGQILNALNDIKAYERTHANSYAFCQFNDVHEVFGANEPNFIDYNKGYKVLSRMLFLGDMVNTNTATTSQNAIAFMNGAQASKRLVGMGNHEYFKSGISNPEVLYKPLVNSSAIFMQTENDALIYYDDDTDNNVRYIFLDYFYITKSGANEAHLLDDAQLSWCASVMESAGSKDIILAGHTQMIPFKYITDETNHNDFGFQNQQNLVDLITAYKQRGSYSVTIDGVTHTYSFANCTGKFILYTSGHYHALGYADFGFNMFTCPTLQTPYGSGQVVGFTFYLVDPNDRSVRIMTCSKSLSEYASYRYTY